MLTAQKEYLTRRINDILVGKLDSVEKRYGKSLSHKEKYNLVRMGKAKLMPFEGTSYRFGVEYDFSAYEKDGKTHPAYIKAASVLRETALNIQDEIMLGDSDKAMKLLKAFESTKV